MKSGSRAAIAIVIATTLAVAVASRPAPLAAAQSGYTISRTHGGFHLTLHFSRPAFPKDALVTVTITLRNLSRRHIMVFPGFSGPGRCGYPTIQIVSVNAQGQSVEPVPTIPRMVCHGPGPVRLVSFPIGRTVVARQFIVLRSSWLHVQAQLAAFTPPCYCGFNLRAPALYASPVPAPTITIHDVGYNRVALISPRPPGGGPLYYQDWVYCFIGDSTTVTATSWHRARSQTIKGGCPHPDRWHIDAAWLNTPVATLNLGAPHHSARYTR